MQAEWTAGAEAWDAADGSSMAFDEVASCSSTADTVVTWEGQYGFGYCAPEQYGCWNGVCTFHGEHCDITPRAWKSWILVDSVNYAPPFSGGPDEMPDSFEWRKFGMLHEWSHVVGLASHTEDGWDCLGSPSTGQPPVTDGFVNFGGPVCPQSPGLNDLGSVSCLYFCDQRPAVVSWGSNRLDIFVRGANDTVYQKYWAGGSNWSAWRQIPGCIASAPGASTWGVNRLDVFARSCSGSLLHAWSGDGGTTWSSWENLGECIVGSPGVTSWGYNRIDIFVRGCDNALRHLWWDAGWSYWEYQGGCVSAGPATATWTVNQLAFFVRGCDFALYASYWFGAGWSAWQYLGGCLGSEPVADSWGTSRFDVFIRGCAPELWHNYSSTGGGSWSGWIEPMGCLTSGPGATSQVYNTLDVFTRGCPTFEDLFQRTWNGSSWSGWTDRGPWP